MPPIQPEDLQALKARVRGGVLAPGDTAYDEARSVWNAMIDRRPVAVARCLGAADIVAALGFARERGLRVSIKAGGHNISGLAVCEGGLMLDLSLMRGVWVDAPGRRARAQAGCLLGDVDRETQLHGLAAVLGFVSNTGIAGLTLGGGFGYLTPQFGWTCDTVRSVDLVTADGRLVTATADQQPDLFWGLRGGGGNFGVVTSFEYELFPVGPEIVGGAIAWPAERGREVVALYERLVRDAPPELNCVLAFRNAPPAPWLAKAIHGKPIVALFICHTGSMADAERAVAPVKSLGGSVGDIVQRRPYASQQSLLDATQPKGRRYYWKSEYLPAVTADLLEAARRHAAGIPSPHGAIIVFPLGGALNTLPADHSPVGNREARAIINIAAAWDRPDDDAVNMEWARAVWRDIRPFSTGGTYVNFLTEEEGVERIRDAYGSNYARLAAVKAAWDPANVFSTNKNIAPAAGQL